MAPTRARRRMDLDQLSTSLSRVTDGLGWTEGRPGAERDQFEELSRTLGKPDQYHGASEKWRDWKLVFLAYAGAVNPRLEELMQQQVGRDTAVLLQRRCG